jgi:hypothetical protein
MGKKKSKGCLKTKETPRAVQTPGDPGAVKVGWGHGERIEGKKGRK